MAKDYFPGYAEKAERRKLRSLTGIVLAVIAGLVIAGVATCAQAAPVFRSEAHGHPVVLRLLEEPCCGSGGANGKGAANERS